MIYFNGIDIKTSEMDFLQLYFLFSKLDIYSNNSLVGSNQCNNQTFKESKYFFANFNNIFLFYVKYPDYLCPLIFSNSVIYSIYFDDISNSYLNKNRLHFSEMDDELANKNEPIINNLVFNVKYDSLTLKNLDKYVFKFVFKLSIYGYLNDIQNDLFGYFRMKVVDILIDNYREFYNKGNKWMKYLNNKVRVNLSDANEVNEKINEHYTIIRLQ
jgi:hypothetical protein